MTVSWFDPVRCPSGAVPPALLGGAGAAILAACTDGGVAPDPTAPSSTTPERAPTPIDGADVVEELLDPVVDAPVGLLVTFFPTLSGEDRSFTFGLIDAEQNPAPGLDVQVWFVAPDRETVAGPFDPTFYPAETPALTAGAYETRVTLEGSGTYDVVVATTDGSVAGTGAQQVRGPSQALVVPPGQPLPVAETPTVDDRRTWRPLHAGTRLLDALLDRRRGRRVPSPPGPIIATPRSAPRTCAARRSASSRASRSRPTATTSTSSTSRSTSTRATPPPTTSPS